MRISDYIRDRWLTISTGILVVMAIAMFLTAMGTPLAVVVIVIVLLLLWLAAMGFYDCLRKKHYYDELERTWALLDEKSYLAEVMEDPGFYDGQLLKRMIRRHEKYLNDVISQGQAELLEYKDYAQTWVHEIKTPIAVARLIIGNNKNPVTDSIEEELARIEYYVEQMLYYTKSASLEADYMIQPVKLKALVMNVIRKNMKMMVAAHVLPKLENLDFDILTDTKWMEFILTQIVTNSVKYCDSSRKPEISFDASCDGSGQIILSVADNGIGIPAGDVGRVFKKGFTGENGRIFTKSTGMGLYLCKNLCDKMGIAMALRSQQGQGTTVTFVLKQNRL